MSAERHINPWLIAVSVMAMAMLVLIVWWTMFSGRSEAEAEHEAAQREASQSDKPAP